MKKALKIIGILLVIIIAAVALFIVTYQPDKYSDFGVYTDLRNYVTSGLKSFQAKERPVSDYFRDFTMEISFPYSKIFGSDVMAIPLVSFENDRIAAASISQFEVPPRSSYYRDFTLNIRPRYGVKAPVMHIDFMKPAAGTPGLCTLDFFNVDPETISLEEFFGNEQRQVQRAVSGVEKYQRTVEEGRGKITQYLDPYKSTYRLELMEPETEDESVREEYYQAAGTAIKLLFPIYVRMLNKAEVDPGYAERHEAKTKEFIQLMYSNDFAIALGKRIFKDHFKKYWLDGFWNVEVALKE